MPPLAHDLAADALQRKESARSVDPATAARAEIPAAIATRMPVGPARCAVAQGLPDCAAA